MAEDRRETTGERGGTSGQKFVAEIAPLGHVDRETDICAIWKLGGNVGILALRPAMQLGTANRYDDGPILFGVGFVQVHLG